MRQEMKELKQEMQTRLEVVNMRMSGMTGASSLKK